MPSGTYSERPPYTASRVLGYTSECVPVLFDVIDNAALDSIRTDGHSLEHSKKTSSPRARYPSIIPADGTNAMTETASENIYGVRLDCQLR